MPRWREKPECFYRVDAIYPTILIIGPGYKEQARVGNDAVGTCIMFRTVRAARRYRNVIRIMHKRNYRIHEHRVRLLLDQLENV